MTADRDAVWDLELEAIRLEDARHRFEHALTDLRLTILELEAEELEEAERC